MRDKIDFGLICIQGVYHLPTVQCTVYTCVFFYKVQLQLQGKLGLNSELKLTLSIASN